MTAAPGIVRITNTWNDRSPFFLPGALRARCELGMTTAVPLTLDLDLALTTTRLDATASPPSRLAVTGALNDVRLRLGAPAADVRLDLEGAFNRVVLEVPAATPVRVRREGFLNVVDDSHAGRDRAPRDGGADGGPGGAPGYRLSLQGAFNRVVVKSW